MSAPAASILIADDQPDVVEALRLLLKTEGYHTHGASSPSEIIAALEQSTWDALLMDLNYSRDTTSGREGIELLPRVVAMDATLPVIVMTAWGSVESAVEAMRLGARDYIEKPWDNTRLLATVRTQVELGRALRRGARLESENERLRAAGLPVMVAESRAMRAVVTQLERIAPSDANVLLTGEHGSGKEVAARWLHASSARAKRPLVIVNAGAIPETLYESELFGHVKGAFTDARTDRIGCFEAADGGTLFLDEIATVPLRQQSKLLRVLETGELQRVGSSRTVRTNVRVLSATNADLSAEVAAGRFREDLLYRLNTVEVHIPPLRERAEDIPALAHVVLHELLGRYGRRERSLTFDAGAMAALQAHSWPGNVRELRHAVERAVLMATGSTIRAADLALRARAEPAPSVDGGGPTEEPSLPPMTLEDAERALIRQALGRAGGNVSRAADALGLSRSALYRRMQHFGL
jgi:DNA-binding NtrC family response regulator